MRRRRVRLRPDQHAAAAASPAVREPDSATRSPRGPLETMQSTLGNAAVARLARSGTVPPVATPTELRLEGSALPRPLAAQRGPRLISRQFVDDTPQENLSEASQGRWNAIADDMRALAFDMGAAHMASGLSSPTRAQWLNQLGGPLLTQLAGIDSDVKLEHFERTYRAFERHIYDSTIAATTTWGELQTEYEAEQADLAGDPDPVSAEALKYLTETYEADKRRIDAGAIHFLTEDDFNQIKFVLDNDRHISLGELRGARVRVDALIEMLEVVEELRYEGRDEDHILPGWDDAVLAERDELQRLLDQAPTSDYAGQYQRLIKDLMDERGQALAAKPREKGFGEKVFLLGKGAISAVVDPVIEAGKQLVDLSQIGLHFLSGGKYDPRFISDMAEAAEQGATTGDLLTGMAKGLIETPERFLKAVEAGDWEAIGRETANLYMLAKAGKAGSGQAAKMLRWAKARQVATRAMRNGGEGAAINFNKQLSASGFKGTLAEGRPGFGVFEGQYPGVSKPVAVKVYPDTPEWTQMFLDEMAGAQAASRARGGPRFYGEVPAGPGKRAFAMEKVEGGFTDNMSTAPRGSPEWNAAEAQAQFVTSRVTARTVADVQKFGNSLLRRGYYYAGEVQGLVDASGRWRPIDFQGVRRLPPRRDAAAYQEALESHRSMVDLEAASYQRILNDRAAARTP